MNSRPLYCGSVVSHQMNPRPSAEPLLSIFGQNSGTSISSIRLADNNRACHLACSHVPVVKISCCCGVGFFLGLPRKPNSCLRKHVPAADAENEAERSRGGVVIAFHTVSIASGVNLSLCLIIQSLICGVRIKLG